MKEIFIKGLEKLGKEDKFRAEELLNQYIFKIERMLKSEIELKIVLKEYEKDGNRKKYSISAKVLSSENIFKAKDFDWNLPRLIHKVMNKLETEIEHKLHVSEQHQFYKWFYFNFNMDLQKKKVIVDILMFIDFLILTVSGFVLWKFLPSFSGSGKKSFIFDRINWILIHDWAALIIVILVVIHLILNWRLIVCMFRFKKSKEGEKNYERK